MDSATPNMEWVAVCDKDTQRLDIAKNEFPHLNTYNSVSDLLDKADIDMVFNRYATLHACTYCDRVYESGKACYC